MTNFERIKTMTVEKLAEMMSTVLTCGYCPMYEVCLYETYDEYEDYFGADDLMLSDTKKTCKQKLKKWLESEAEEDDKP